MSEPDLTAELDAAEDIVTGRAESVVTEVWWGVRYRSSCGQHITSYGGEGDARDEIDRSNRLHRDMKATLLRREVTTITTPWEEVAPGDSNADSNRERGHQRTTRDKGARNQDLPHWSPPVSGGAQDYGSQDWPASSAISLRHSAQSTGPRPGTSWMRWPHHEIAWMSCPG